MLVLVYATIPSATFPVGISSAFQNSQGYVYEFPTLRGIRTAESFSHFLREALAREPLAKGKCRRQGTEFPSFPKTPFRVSNLYF